MAPRTAMQRQPRLQMPPPGHTYAMGDDGKLYTVPNADTADYRMQYTHAMSGLGQHPQDHGSRLRDDPAIREQYDEIPAFYTVTIDLGTTAGDTAANSVTLRPENFILERITFASQGDTYIDFNAAGGSTDGRSVIVSWSDEFTKFLGQTPCLVSALFGDSQGYLDIPRGIMFQGKQTLQVSLSRLSWVGSDTPPTTTRWDFNFQGVGLLPKNAGGTSGSLR